MTKKEEVSMETHDIAIVGGTGAQGRGLALRFVEAGHRVRVLSRDLGRAREAAQLISEKTSTGDGTPALTAGTYSDGIDGAAVHLWKHEGLLEEEDVLVCGGDPEATAKVAALARAVTGHQGIICGPLRVARELEPLTSAIIHINKRYKRSVGVRLVGLDR